MKRFILLAILVSGCTTIEIQNLGAPFVSANDSFQSIDRPKDTPTTGKTAKIGFVEFDDLGFQKDPEAVANVFTGISQLNSKSVADPLLMVVFIHGWHHNAAPDDSNVQAFKEFLSQLQYEEDNVSFSSHKRQVVGVYIGWRGESNESIINPLTYRSRKLAGLRVGEYGLQEILVQLKTLRNSNNNNRLVAIGHSFGGGVLYSSVMQNLVDSVVSAKRENSESLSKINKAYGDLVILLNPALEAARVETLNRRLTNVNFDQCQPLVLASFTSEKDTALSVAFPKGQDLFFPDDDKVAVASDRKDLVVTSYGNKVAYQTHELTCDTCSYSLEPSHLTADQYRDAHAVWDGFRRNNDAEFVVGDIKLKRSPQSKVRAGTPIMNVYVKGGTLMKEHNDIWGGDFSMFARALIGMEFSKNDTCR